MLEEVVPVVEVVWSSPGVIVLKANNLLLQSSIHGQDGGYDDDLDEYDDNDDGTQGGLILR